MPLFRTGPGSTATDHDRFPRRGVFARGRAPPPQQYRVTPRPSLAPLPGTPPLPPTIRWFRVKPDPSSTGVNRIPGPGDTPGSGGVGGGAAGLIVISWPRM